MISIKKVLATIALVGGLCLAGGTKAEAQNVFETGTNLMSIGVGANLHTNANGHQSGVFSLNLAADRCLNGNLWDNNSAFTLGGQGIVNMYGGGVSYFLGPRAGLHYHFIPALDTYIFAAIGFSGSHSNNSKASSFGFGYNAGLGLRYMVAPNWGLFVEGGYGATVINLGASFSF